MGRKNLHAIVLGLASTLLLAARPGEALTLVNPAGGCAQTLSVAGEYLLTGDLACSGPVSGIIITASNVTFHLGGHTISNTTCDLGVSFGGIFVTGPVSGVQVDGGTVSGFNDGIILHLSSSAQVRGMKVKDSCVFGMAVSGQGNWIDKNLITGSHVDGLGLGQATGTIVTFNDISGNARVGVDISNFSNQNIVYNNIIHDNGVNEGYGVAIFNGAVNLVLDNVLNNNFNGIGILSAGNLAQGNRVSGSKSGGIFISGVGAPSAVRQNVVLGNPIDMSDATAACGTNSWQNNTFETDQVAGVSDGGPASGCIR